MGGLAVVGDRHIKMIHAGADVGNDRRDLRAAIRHTLAVHEYPDRFIELAYAFHRRAELQFGIKCDLEKAILDFTVGKIRSFRSAPSADVGVFCIRRTVNDPGKRDRDQGEGHYHRLADEAHTHTAVPRAEGGKALDNGNGANIFVNLAKNNTPFPTRGTVATRAATGLPFT